jgi:predicted dehydrogenase
MKGQGEQLRILVVGCGNMGSSHAIAYHNIEGFEICGLVSRGKSKEVLNARLGNIYPVFDDMDDAIKATRPDAVCISTYPDTHEGYAIKAFENGCHVFIEKPLADSVEGAKRVVRAAEKANKKLAIY